MAFQPIIPAATAAVTNKADFDASLWPQVIIAADNLAGIETAAIFLKVNGSYVPMVNVLGTAAGLTVALPAIVLPGGCVYGVTKVLTAGACGVFGSGVGVP